MIHLRGFPFDVSVWRPSLNKGSYAPDGHYLRRTRAILCEPALSTKLFAILRNMDRSQGFSVTAPRKCLSQADGRPAVAVAPSYSLGVVGTSLVLEGATVEVAVAGCTLVDLI